jgi:hypothetical protein
MLRVPIVQNYLYWQSLRYPQGLFMLRALSIPKQPYHPRWQRSSQCLGILINFSASDFAKSTSPQMFTPWFMSLHLDTWFWKSCPWANSISITRGFVRDVREGVPPSHTEPAKFWKSLGAALTSPLRDSAACSNLRVIKAYDAELVLGMRHFPLPALLQSLSLMSFLLSFGSPFMFSNIWLCVPLCL